MWRVTNENFEATLVVFKMTETMYYCISGKPLGMPVMSSDLRVSFIAQGSGSVSSFVAGNLWTLFGYAGWR